MAAPPGPTDEQFGRLNAEYCHADTFGFFSTLVEQYGDIVGFSLGARPYIFVNGALQVHELFSRYEACLRKPEFIKDSNRGHWGDGLTTLEGTDWKSRRRVLAARFRPEFVAEHLPIVAQCTEAMLDSWVSGTGADLIEDVRILTARIAVRAVLGAELEGYGAPGSCSAVVPLVEAYGEPYQGAPGGDLVAPLIVVRPRAPQSMDRTIRIIDERIASGECRGDILSHLVQAGRDKGGGLTRNEIIGEVMQLLYAGHHTIPGSLMNFWRDIAAPDMCARISAEADDLCAAGIPGSDRIADSYCLAALKESMRIHPAAPVLYREVETGFELDGYEFPRDVGVWVSPQLLHNNPDNFPEPHRFMPERFLRGGSAVAARSPYFPFGAGRRACVATQMSLHQMALIALLAARRFNFISNQQAVHGLQRNRRF